MDLESAPIMLTTTEVGRLLGVSRITVWEWRRSDRGPRFERRLSGAVVYRRSDIEAWLAAGNRPSMHVTSLADAPSGGAK